MEACSTLLVCLSLTPLRQILCDEQNLCFVPYPPGIHVHSLPFFSSFLIPFFHKVCAVSAISCIAPRSHYDLIYKKYTTLLMLFINLQKKCVSLAEGHSATPRAAY